MTVRHESGLETSCDLPGAPGEVLVEVVDISTRGIGLVLERQLRPGSCLEITLSNGPESKPYRVWVVRLDRLAAGLWFAGCEFARPLDEAELLAWL